MAVLHSVASPNIPWLRASLNEAARLVTGTKGNVHISPVLKSLNWLPYEARIQLKIACLSHKALHFKTPNNLAQKLEISGGGRSSRSANSLLLKRRSFAKREHANELSPALHRRSGTLSQLKFVESPPRLLSNWK